MKRVILRLFILLTAFSVKAEDYLEAYNELSDAYVNEIIDLPIIRTIRGGTIITPEFDTSCPEYMKAPFSYACKIVEEYMPQCLPLRVKVSCGRVNSSSGNSISKVSSLAKENFGSSSHYNNATMSTIKGVILGEYVRKSSATYIEHVPDTLFLTEKPDIEITYNQQKLDEIYFSLDTIPGEKYDFVSIAIRDLFRGLGLISGYRYNSLTGGLQNPSREMLPFECFIDEVIGNYGDSIARLDAATQGELILKKSLYDTSLKLYAPTTWTNGVSLNYFIPQDNCALSKILSYDFSKGQVLRSLNDNYSWFIFEYLLGWVYDYTTLTSTPTNSGSGSTSLIMPYNGTFNLDDCGEMSTNIAVEAQNVLALSNSTTFDELTQYVKQFHPFQTGDDEYYESGVSVSILKKDGTWDLVQFISVYVPGMEVEFNMADWTFNYENEEYARTADGYLRARITRKFTDNYNRETFSTTYIVLDYLPQKVVLGYDYTDSTESIKANAIEPLASSEVNNVRLYFSDIEGVDRIMIECLREGFRVPSRIQITDVKKGYYDTTIDRNTTFTAVSYNDNGNTRSVPITIEFISNSDETESPALEFNLQGNEISINSVSGNIDSYNYSISPLTANTTQTINFGTTDGTIDVSDLNAGLYVLTVTSEKTGNQETFKFSK